METVKRNTRGNQTFYALKDSLLALLEEKGAAQITVDDICQRCGVTKGAFYHHFNSREELLAQVYTAKMNDYIVDKIRQAQSEYPDRPDKQIRSWVDAIMGFSVQHRGDICRYLYKGSHSSTWQHIVSDWNSLVQAQLSKWHAQGLLRGDVTAEELHAYCDSFTYGFSALFSAEYIRRPIPPALVDSFIRTLFPA